MQPVKESKNRLNLQYLRNGSISDFPRKWNMNLGASTFIPQKNPNGYLPTDLVRVQAHRELPDSKDAAVDEELLRAEESWFKKESRRRKKNLWFQASKFVKEKNGLHSGKRVSLSMTKSASKWTSKIIGKSIRKKSRKSNNKSSSSKPPLSSKKLSMVKDILSESMITYPPKYTKVDQSNRGGVTDALHLNAANESNNCPEDDTLSSDIATYDYQNINDAQILFNRDQRYPDGFPDLYNVINNYTMNEESFARLEPYESDAQYLDDDIINSFFSLLPDWAKSWTPSLLVFDTYFCQSIFENEKINDTFLRWGLKKHIDNKKIWLIPINRGRHWTLMMVLLPEKVMVLFDSPHGRPYSIVVNAIGTLIQNLCDKGVKWKEWKLYYPDDIPNRRISEMDPGGDCGVHICSWGLISALSCYTEFSQDDMSFGRKAIANILNVAVTTRPLESLKMDRALMFQDGVAPGTYGKILPIYSQMTRLKEVPIGFKTTFDFCASLKYLIQPDYDRRQRRLRQ
ncbi:hypothetical protein QAD02_003539 [Eretmocerus hayati]|uniref:Uncharacterized protein n=1 Tax=Eretmocerus hayati TaxID=131215 RepID=A0ACC2NLZ5_9HYME|nr:hypothetical protein QAD02_003539 [Eretmocerus hayati]